MKPVIKKTTPHGHKDYLEIIYIREGSGTHQIDHRRFPVSPATLYLVLPGQVHHWELTAVPAGSVMMLKKDFFLDHPLYNLFFGPFPLPFRNAVKLNHVEQTVSWIFSSIQHEHETRKPNFKAVIQAYLLLLFNLLKRESGQVETLSYPVVINRFFDLLGQNFNARYPVTWYAETLNITPKSLNQTCRKYLGKTTGQLITEKTTTEAQKQLLYSTDSLSEIAYRLGFSDLSHFNKFFKRQTGLLPGLYRQSIA